MTPAGSDIRVVNAGVGLPTALVARVFEEAGAHVVHGPQATATEHRYPGLAMWAGEKHSASELVELLAESDVLLVGGESSPEASSPVDVSEELLARHPRLIVLDISGYLPGVADPTPAVDLLVQARLGLTHEMFRDVPTPIALAPTCYGAALLGAIGVWAALLDRLATGRGQVVRVTLQQGAALFWSHLWMGSDTADPDFDRVPPLDVRHLVFRCRDGRYVQLVLGVPGAVGRLYSALDIEGDVDPAERGAPDAERAPEDYFAERAPIAAAIAGLDAAEVEERLISAGLPVGVVGGVREALGREQPRICGLVRRGPDGEQWGAVPVQVSPAASAGPSAAPRSPWRRAGQGRGPLEGLRVLDFGNWVAGPFASRLLADLGAEVISVDPPEGLSHLTGVRNVISVNRGKRSVVLDLKTPEGLAAAHACAASVDVVCHNFRVGVAERLGVDARSLRALNPDLVYLHTSAFGELGPWAERPGFDMVAQAICGHELRAGGVGNEPLWTRSPFVDYAAGALGAIAILEGLHARARTGVPQDVGVSLFGAALFLRSDCYVDGKGEVRGQVRLDAARLGFSPAEALYRTADGWIAISASCERMASALCRLLRLPAARDWTRWGERERSAIEEWAVLRSTADALASLSEAGVWAAESRPDEWKKLSDTRQPGGHPFVIEVDDPRFGRIRGVFGPQISFDHFPVTGELRYLSAPAAGAHTAQVLGEAGTGSTQSEKVGL